MSTLYATFTRSWTAFVYHDWMFLHFIFHINGEQHDKPIYNRCFYGFTNFMPNPCFTNHHIKLYFNMTNIKSNTYTVNIKSAHWYWKHNQKAKKTFGGLVFNKFKWKINMKKKIKLPLKRKWVNKEKVPRYWNVILGI